jgi:hypothetical protein
MKYWEIIANQLSAGGWSWGMVECVTSRGVTIYCLDAHRGQSQRYIVRSDELLTAFLELHTQNVRRPQK